MKRSVWWLSLLLLVLMVGCSAEETPLADAQTRGTLRIAHNLGYGGAESADPASQTPYDHVLTFVYNRLVQLDGDGKFAPELAESWEANADATEWTFNLRSGVQFHDGTAFTAADVKYSFERIVAPGSDSPLASVLDTLDFVEAVDDQTAVFHLSSTAVEFPLLLTDRRMRILKSFGEIGLGTGPFQIANFDPADTTRLIAFDAYWQGKPQLAAIESIALPTSGSQLAALSAGELHLVDDLSPKDGEQFVRRNEFFVQSIPTGDWRGIVFRTDMPPFDDVRVRQAVRLVADRQEMIDVIANGEQGATIACDSPVAPSDVYHLPPDCAPDIEEAKRLLAEAGFDNDLRFTLTTSKLDTYWPAMAEIYQYQAAKAGITVNIKEAPIDGYWSDVWMVEPVVMTSWTARTAAQVLAEAFQSDAAFNESFWENEEFDALLSEAGATTQLADRQQLYAEIQQLLRDESGTLIPFHVKVVRVVSADVQNLDPVNKFIVPWHLVSVDER